MVFGIQSTAQRLPGTNARYFEPRCQNCYWPGWEKQTNLQITTEDPVRDSNSSLSIISIHGYSFVLLQLLENIYLLQEVSHIFHAGIRKQQKSETRMTAKVHKQSSQKQNKNTKKYFCLTSVQNTVHVEWSKKTCSNSVTRRRECAQRDRFSPFNLTEWFRYERPTRTQQTHRINDMELAVSGACSSQPCGRKGGANSARGAGRLGRQGKLPDYCHHPGEDRSAYSGHPSWDTGSHGFVGVHGYSAFGGRKNENTVIFG